MLNEYNQGRLIFKLYGVEESSLTEYKKYLLANFGGGVTADFERKGDDFTLYLWYIGNVKLLFYEKKKGYGK